MVRRVLPAVRRAPLLAGVLVLAVAAAPARGASRPVVAQGDLWATVNVCDPPSKPGAVGLRASMPPRRLKAGASSPGRWLAQWMRFRIEYYDSGAKVWKPVGSGGDSGWQSVGKGRKTVETGYTFTYKVPSAGHSLQLRGQVDFQWRAGKRVVSSARRRTLTGYAKPNDPDLVDSRDSCTISR
jgi:hypothetical protein